MNEVKFSVRIRCFGFNVHSGEQVHVLGTATGWSLVFQVDAVRSDQAYFIKF